MINKGNRTRILDFVNGALDDEAFGVEKVFKIEKVNGDIDRMG